MNFFFYFWQTRNFEHNKFSGSLPASIGSLSKMRNLDLIYNDFTGAIPATIGDLSALQIL